MADENPTTTTPETTIPDAAAPAAADPVIACLVECGVDAIQAAQIKEDLGVGTVDDLGLVTEQDLIETTGMKKIKARSLVAKFKPAAPAAPEPVAAPHPSAAAVAVIDDILPSVPTDASWLEALRTGGVLKVNQSTVISAIRAALAYRVGLYGIPDQLVRLMEEFADANDEQVDPSFFKLRKQIRRKEYAEVFEAVEGLDGTFVTETRKKRLLDKIDDKLWPSIIAFSGQLKSWQEAWMQGAANPALMMNAMMAATGTGVALPPGMMQPPDTGVLRDHADAVADAINRVFSGTGVQIAAALAYEATKIKETLADPRLPALTGATNREQMLRLLGVAVSATYPRMETNVTRFVLATMQVKDQAAGAEELRYFSSLIMLGQQIPWDQLTSSVSNGGGRKGSSPMELSGIGRTRREL